MDVSLFDFDLPEERIALRPAVPRDSARLLVVHADGRLEHRTVRDLPDYLRAGDALLLNDTKVIPARLFGQRLREAGPAKIEILLHRRLAADRYAVLARPARKLAVGDALAVRRAEGRGRGARRQWRGGNPLCPVRRRAGCRHRRRRARCRCRPTSPASARPTRGIAPTTRPCLRARKARWPRPPRACISRRNCSRALEQKGVARETVTLHVGLGTFLPVTADDTSQHRMHAERAMLDAATAARLNAVHAAGGRIAAVGTTSLRTLESAAGDDGVIRPFDGDTDIFITPGYRFRAADLLLTNFHLPRSTLFMLVGAFMGLETDESGLCRGHRARAIASIPMAMPVCYCGRP